MNKHLNAFRGYTGPPTHEDQLTRAAMIVLRAIPLARDALLARLEAPPVAQLPECTFDMQTRNVFEELDDTQIDGDGEQTARELISLYLSPDENIDFTGKKLNERTEREQRLDGVMRFGDELVIAIESKIVGGQPTDQAENLRLRGVEADSRIEGLSWHLVLEDWWDLLERDLLAPAEAVLMNDLIDFAEQNFAHLLPFTTLRRAGDNDRRRQRRLMAILREATNGADGLRARGAGGAELMLGPYESTQRIALESREGDLVLLTWPAELQPDARRFYRTDRTDRLLDLRRSDPEQWNIVPNPHLGYWNAKHPLYTHCELDAETYIEQWNGPDYEWLHSFSGEGVRGELWPWLKTRGYAAASDDSDLEPFIDSMGGRPAIVRPGLQVERQWLWTDAVQLDERKRLVGEVAEAISSLLGALREKLPEPAEGA
jgi:hypothetical protein